MKLVDVPRSWTEGRHYALGLPSNLSDFLRHECFEVVPLEGFDVQRVVEHFGQFGFSRKLPDYRNLSCMVDSESGCIPAQGLAYYALGVIRRVSRCAIGQYDYYAPRITHDSRGRLFMGWVNLSLPMTYHDMAMVSKQAAPAFV